MVYIAVLFFLCLLHEWKKLKVKYSKLFTKKFIADSTYWDGMVNIFNILNKDLHKVLDVDAIMILKIFFCYWNTFLLNGEFPQNMIPYSIMEWKWEEYIILSVAISLRNYVDLIT